ncbi:hypothetical protein P8452_18905 [Trifolium repens]|nr:hypothetical protein P8452_18905 [Trifolium repens]
MAVPNSLNSEMAVPESSNTQMIPKALSTRMKQSASRGKSRGKITRKHPQIRGRFELFLKQNQHSKKPVKDILQKATEPNSLSFWEGNAPHAAV